MGRFRVAFRAIFFIGSIRDRMVWRHQSSKDLPANARRVVIPELLEVLVRREMESGRTLFASTQPFRGAGLARW